MYLAQRAGIRLLATGAIGGAARETPDGEVVWDISADLIELLNTPVAVVSAGARSVHNLAFTAEMLETFRVPVIGYGTDTFPTFYMRAGTHRKAGAGEYSQRSRGAAVRTLGHGRRRHCCRPADAD